MATVKLKPDTLDADTERFGPSPLTSPVFLNSIPKSGSHLLRNILRMFVPIEQQYRAQFIQWPNLQQHLAAFDPARNYLSFGHLFFSDASAIELAPVRKILLYRDPYDWVLARARFFLSDEFEGNVSHIKDGQLSVDDLLSLMIFGIHPKTPSLGDMYQLNVAAWLGSSSVHAVRYEELARNANNPDTDEAAAYFAELLGACGIAPLPANWSDRVKVGSDRRQSGTARENLTGVTVELPESLPARHRQLVEYTAPGLRQLLGYA